MSGSIVPERGETGVVGGRKDKGLLGENREDGGVRRSDGVEQVDAVAEKRERGPTGEAEDGGYRARGLGGDSGGLSLTIRTSAGGAAKNDAAVPLDGKGGESVRRKDCVGGNEKPAFVQRERYPSGSEDADSVLGNEVRDASVDEKAGVIDVG